MKYLNLEKYLLTEPHSGPGVKIRRGAELLLIRTQHAVLQLGTNEMEVWDMLNGELTVAEIVAALSRKHGVDYALVARSVQGFVDHLLERGLLRTKPTP